MRYVVAFSPAAHPCSLTANHNTRPQNTEHTCTRFTYSQIAHLVFPWACRKKKAPASFSLFSTTTRHTLTPKRPEPAKPNDAQNHFPTNKSRPLSLLDLNRTVSLRPVSDKRQQPERV